MQFHGDNQQINCFHCWQDIGETSCNKADETLSHIIMTSSYHRKVASFIWKTIKLQMPSTDCWLHSGSRAVVLFEPIDACHPKHLKFIVLIIYL